MIDKVQIYLFFFIICLTGCQHSDKKKIPDVSHIDVDIEIVRFDQEQNKLESNKVSAWDAEMRTKYGFFYKDFLKFLLEIKNPDDSTQVNSVLRQVANDQIYVDIGKSVQKKYPKLSDVEKELEQAFRYLKYYRPESTVPKVYSFFSYFALQIPIGEDYVGIGLDMFLGADSEFYPMIVEDVPRYISRRFTPENIVSRVMESLFRVDYWPQPDGDLNTLEQMIYNGKILYAMDLVLPETADSLKIGYSTDQMDWAERYEKDIWSWFLGEDLLFQKDIKRIQHYFNEAPFTRELGENNKSAPRLGIYIGWKIVQKYMEQHPDMSLSELFALNDAQQFLQDSKYKAR